MTLLQVLIFDLDFFIIFCNIGVTTHLADNMFCIFHFYEMVKLNQGI